MRNEIRSEMRNGIRNERRNQMINNTMRSGTAKVQSVGIWQRNGILRMTAFLLVVVIAMVFLLAAGRSESKTMAASNTGDAYKYYTSIQVSSGDSLWSIATEYMTAGYSDIAAYIEEVKSLNHLGDDEIHAGEYLLIPYYSDEYKEG